tara:strand:- start:387 stop:509 length:123 start_codon:yes stop_codon:yes gene_type:complete
VGKGDLYESSLELFGTRKAKTGPEKIQLTYIMCAVINYEE